MAVSVCLRATSGSAVRLAACRWITMPVSVWPSWSCSSREIRVRSRSCATTSRADSFFSRRYAASQFAAQPLLFQRALPLGHHALDDLRQRAQLVLGEVVLGAAAQHVHGGFLADGAGHHHQRRAATPRDQDLQRRVGREPGQVEVAQDDVEVVLQRVDEAGGVLDAVQLRSGDGDRRAPARWP